MGKVKIVAGNWKMNTDLPEALNLVKQIVQGQSNKDVIKVFFPPFPFLKEVSDKANAGGFYTGAQDCSEHEKGAYTGEVSASMIRSCDARYVLIGHSERRTYFKEDAAQFISKIEQALKNDLIPVFCYGEQLAERKNNTYNEIIATQLTSVLRNFTAEQVSKFILAYEPVWAIGTGETATPQQAQEAHKLSRDVLADLFNSQPVTQVPILYGGSCNAQNAKELFSCPDVDGGLIGGASLKAEDFCKITNSF
jgi:triosephosphate isomerase